MGPAPGKCQNNTANGWNWVCARVCVWCSSVLVGLRPVYSSSLPLHRLPSFTHLFCPALSDTELKSSLKYSYLRDDVRIRVRAKHIQAARINCAKYGCFKTNCSGGQTCNASPNATDEPRLDERKAFSVPLLSIGSSIIHTSSWGIIQQRD